MSEDSTEISELERLYVKNIFDYLRHLSTLSTGSVILLVTLVEKVFPHPRWKASLVVSLLSFTLSIIGSVAAHTMFLGVGAEGAPEEWKGERAGYLAATGMVATWSGFLLGIIAFITFALKNLLTL
jgi:hypothetical protein